VRKKGTSPCLPVGENSVRLRTGGSKRPVFERERTRYPLEIGCGGKCEAAQGASKAPVDDS